MNNTIKTILFFGVFAALLIAVGRYVGGYSGMVAMAVFGIAANIAAYYFSDKIALMSASAKPLDGAKYPALEQMVRELTDRAGIIMPRMYISPSAQPNAFATGRNPSHAAIVVTQGLLQNLERDELRGVLAHEIGHIKNRDILIATVAAVFASVITSAANLLHWTSFMGNSDEEEGRNPLVEIIIIALAPLAALIIQLAISRSREYQADKTGARLAGDPNGLANALLKIERVAQTSPPATTNPAFENLYIANPLGSTLGMFQSLFSTHPPIADRVKKLREWNY